MDENIRDVGIQSISRLDNTLAKNPRGAVESELEFWETEIFPLLDAYYIPKYQFICEEILHKVGYEDITPKRLRDIVYRVRNKRITTQNKSPASTIVQNTPKGSNKQINEVIDTTRSIEVIKPIIAVPSKPIISAIPGEKIVPDWHYDIERDRLTLEGKIPNAPWTETDDKIYQYMKQICYEKNIDMKTEYYKLDKNFISSSAKYVISSIHSKRQRLGLDW
jgi:hypothetical protein